MARFITLLVVILTVLPYVGADEPSCTTLQSRGSWNQQGVIGSNPPQFSHQLLTAVGGDVVYMSNARATGGKVFLNISQYNVLSGVFNWNFTIDVGPVSFFQYGQAWPKTDGTFTMLLPGFRLAVDQTDDSVYAVGQTAANSFNGELCQGEGDAFILKLSKSGEIMWSKLIVSTPSHEALVGVQVDPVDSNVYVYGFAYGAIFDWTQAWKIMSFTLGVDNNGNIKWKRRIAPKAPDSSVATLVNDMSSVTIEQNERYVYIVGSTDGVVGGRNYGGYDIFVCKLAVNDGSNVWCRQHGSSALEAARTISVSTTVGVIVGGITTQLSAAPDITYGMYSLDANLQWFRVFPTVGWGGLENIEILDSSGWVLLVGHTQGTKWTSTGIIDIGQGENTYVVQQYLDLNTGTIISVDQACIVIGGSEWPAVSLDRARAAAYLGLQTNGDILGLPHIGEGTDFVLHRMMLKNSVCGTTNKTTALLRARVEQFNGNTDQAVDTLYSICQLNTSCPDRQTRYACTVLRNMQQGLNVFGNGKLFVELSDWASYKSIIKDYADAMSDVGQSQGTQRTLDRLSSVQADLRARIEANHRMIESLQTETEREYKSLFHEVRTTAEQLGQQISAEASELESRLADLSEAESCRYLKTSMRLNGIQATANKIWKQVHKKPCNFFCKIGNFFKSIANALIPGLGAVIDIVGDAISAIKSVENRCKPRNVEMNGYDWNPFKDLINDPTGASCSTAFQALFKSLVGKCRGNVILSVIKDIPGAETLYHYFSGNNLELTSSDNGNYPAVTGMMTMAFHVLQDRDTIEQRVNGTISNRFVELHLDPRHMNMYLHTLEQYVKSPLNTNPSAGAIMANLKQGRVSNSMYMNGHDELLDLELEMVSQNVTVSNEAMAHIQCMFLTTKALDVVFTAQQQLNYWMLSDTPPPVGFPGVPAFDDCSSFAGTIEMRLGDMENQFLRASQSFTQASGETWVQIPLTRPQNDSILDRFESNGETVFQIAPPAKTTYRRVDLKQSYVAITTGNGVNQEWQVSVTKLPSSSFVDGTSLGRLWTFYHPTIQKQVTLTPNQCQDTHPMSNSMEWTQANIIPLSPYGVWKVSVSNFDPKIHRNIQRIDVQFQVKYEPKDDVGSDSNRIFRDETVDASHTIQCLGGSTNDNGVMSWWQILLISIGCVGAVVFLTVYVVRKRKRNDYKELEKCSVNGQARPLVADEKL